MTSYPGGKNAVYRTLINRIPPHRVFIEAFLGSGALMRHKRAADVNIGIDVDPLVIRAVIAQDIPSQERSHRAIEGVGKNACEGLQGSRIGESTSKRSLVGETADKRRRFDQPASHRAGPPSVDRDGAHLSRAAAVTPTGSGWPLNLTSVCGDALTWLKHHRSWKGDEFVYADPPYLSETRRGRGRRIYRHELETRAEHSRLLDVLTSLPCMVMISGYWSDLYAERLASWRAITYDATTRGGRVATEWLWMNYDEPVHLHDYRYLGENARKRQDFKRLQQRWIERLRGMGPTKRYALLSAIDQLSED